VSTAQLAPVPDGTACADDGLPCTADACVAGACAHVDAPGFCHTAGGACVAVGEALTPCLTCSGTGTASAVAAGTPCDDGDACTDGDACGFSGLCQGAVQTCCASLVAEEAACGAGITGTTVGGQDALAAYSCNGNTFDGPERVHPFTAPCAGQVFVTFSGPPNVYLVLVRGGLASCAAGACESATGSAVYPVLAAGEVVTLVVDGVQGAAGAYSIDVACACAP
jgi:hypothetical protein